MIVTGDIKYYGFETFSELYSYLIEFIDDREEIIQKMSRVQRLDLLDHLDSLNDPKTEDLQQLITDYL